MLMRQRCIGCGRNGNSHRRKDLARCDQLLSCGEIVAHWANAVTLPGRGSEGYRAGVQDGVFLHYDSVRALGDRRASEDAHSLTGLYVTHKPGACLGRANYS